MRNFRHDSIFSGIRARNSIGERSSRGCRTHSFEHVDRPEKNRAPRVYYAGMARMLWRAPPHPCRAPRSGVARISAHTDRAARDTKDERLLVIRLYYYVSHYNRTCRCCGLGPGQPCALEVAVDVSQL